MSKEGVITYEQMLELARADAADVLMQWQGVDINWKDVRAELDAHWRRGEGSPLQDDPEYRDLVAREIERMRGDHGGRADT